MASVIDLSSRRSLRCARYYEEHADDVRRKARAMRNSEIRTQMLRLATVWDTLAQRAKQQAASRPEPK